VNGLTEEIKENKVLRGKDPLQEIMLFPKDKIDPDEVEKVFMQNEAYAQISKEPIAVDCE